jgi:hypothetical protein
MAFKLIAAAAVLSFGALALADEPTDPVTQACKKGFAWRVPPKEPGEATRLHKSFCLFTNAELVWIRNNDAGVTANGTIE